MSHWWFSLFVLVACVRAVAADLAVSVAVGEPGFYGRIDIGDMPHPELIYRQPITIQPVVGVIRAPIYLHVPPGHAKDWDKHCRHYNACSEHVFFVLESWYNDVYVPKYRERHVKPNHAQGKDKNKERAKPKD
jgi:hypothetical protein